MSFDFFFDCFSNFFFVINNQCWFKQQLESRSSNYDDDVEKEIKKRSMIFFSNFILKLERSSVGLVEMEKKYFEIHFNLSSLNFCILVLNLKGFYENRNWNRFMKFRNTKFCVDWITKQQQIGEKIVVYPWNSLNAAWNQVKRQSVL